MEDSFDVYSRPTLCYKEIRVPPKFCGTLSETLDSATARGWSQRVVTVDAQYDKLAAAADGRRLTYNFGQFITLSVHLSVQRDEHESTGRAGPSATADTRELYRAVSVRRCLVYQLHFFWQCNLNVVYRNLSRFGICFCFKCAPRDKWQVCVELVHRLST